MANAMIQKDSYRLSHEHLDQEDWEDDPVQNEEAIDPKPDRRRSIVTIQLPAKKQKVSEGLTLSDVVESLVFSVSQEDRLESIIKASSFLDHQDQDSHNQEIRAKVDIVLTKHLALLNLKSMSPLGFLEDDIIDLNKEISTSCEALEMVLRASSEFVEVSFNRVGKELLHIIVSLLDNELQSRGQAVAQESDMGSSKGRTDQMYSAGYIKMEYEDDTSTLESVSPPLGGALMEVHNPDQDSMLEAVTKVLGHFARVGAATHMIAHFPGMLRSMLNLVKMRPYHAIPWKARLSCLWTIANLACNTENMVTMMCTSGLVKALVNILSRDIMPNESIETTMEIIRSWSIASRTILNLSWPEENKECLAKNLELVDSLSGLTVKRRIDSPLKNSRTVESILVQVRQHAVSAIRNLASSSFKVQICEFQNSKVLDALTDAALEDNDRRVKKLSFATIHNLTSHETANIIVSRPALILALNNVLLADETEDNSRDHVAATLLILEQSITPGMSSYGNLRGLLDSADFSNENGPGATDRSRSVAV